jgi:adenosylcobinamide-GDP ribazoletransferase
MIKLFRRFLFSVMLLTRIPVSLSESLSLKEIGRSSLFFPMVGGIVGGWLVGVYYLSAALWKEPMLLTACTLVGWITITGGLHLEGLMDSCDGLFCGKPREDMLRIMKDSRVGAFGVIGLVCLTALKVGGLGALPPTDAWKALLTAPVLGRWSMTYAVTAYPYARPEGGMGAAFAEHSDWRCLLGASLIALALTGGIWGLRSLILIPGAFGVTWLVAGWMSKQLGGLTGDTYGALCELTETTVLLLCSLKV